MPADKSQAAEPSAPVGAETELKFDVTPQALRTLAGHPVMTIEPVVRRLRATYFDTEDLALRRAGVSLRVRQEDDRFVQTVKRAAGSALFKRDEWEIDVPSAELDRMALRGTPVAKLTKGKTLAPVFTSDVERQIRTFRDGGVVIEVTVDEGRLMAGKTSAPVLEMELELKAGDPRALYALARGLFDIAPIRLSLLTKSDRGFALAAPTAVTNLKAATTPLSAEMSLSEAFRRIARSCLTQVLAASEDLQYAPTAHGVHQTRVGLRRLRTALEIFGPAVSDGRIDWIVAEARWAAGELGDARALDVFYEDAFQPKAAAVGDARVTARYAAQLEAARKSAYERALAAVASERFARLMLEVALWVENGDWRGAEEPGRAALLASPIGAFAAHALDTLRDRVRKRGSALASGDADGRHKLRLRAKRLRYATQFFEQAFGEDGAKRRRRFAGALKALQDSLGRLNDIASAESLAVKALDGAKAPSLVFAAGQIVGGIKVEEPVEIEKAIEAYDGFREAKRFWPKPPPQPNR